MEERLSQIAVIVGASPLAEELRRTLVRRGAPHAGVSTNLRGLRRSLALGEIPAAVLCIALDRSTLDRLGVELRTLLADHQGFATDVRIVGLLSDRGLTDEIFSLGCDVYVDEADVAAHVVELLATAPVHATVPAGGGWGQPGRRITRGSAGFEAWMFGEGRLPAAVAGRRSNRLQDLWRSEDDPAASPDGT